MWLSRPLNGASELRMPDSPAAKQARLLRRQQQQQQQHLQQQQQQQQRQQLQPQRQQLQLEPEPEPQPASVVRWAERDDRAVDGGEAADIVARLTDPRQFTGAHRARFDPETGQGRGRAGRDSPAKGLGSQRLSPRGSPPPRSQLDLHHLQEAKHQRRMRDVVERHERDARWENERRWKEEQAAAADAERRALREEREERKLEMREAAQRRRQAEAAAVRELQAAHARADSEQWVAVGAAPPEGVPRDSSRSPRARRKAAAAPAVPEGSIFEKLTDHRQFTGAHRARFDRCVAAAMSSAIPAHGTAPCFAARSNLEQRRAAPAAHVAPPRTALHCTALHCTATLTERWVGAQRRQGAGQGGADGAARGLGRAWRLGNAAQPERHGVDR